MAKKRKNGQGTVRHRSDGRWEGRHIIGYDENGKAIDIEKYTTTVSNHIIEEFMLITNKTVAEFLYWTNTPFVYRIHEKPTEEKLHNFNDFIGNGNKISIIAGNPVM